MTAPDLTDAVGRVARPTFPHLENLDRVPEVLDVPVSISEKVHGFNARFGRDAEGVFWCGSRNQEVSTEDGRGLQGFVGFAIEHSTYVPSGFTFFGEWAGKGIQKGVDYGAPDFYMFGVQQASFGAAVDRPVVMSGNAVLASWCERLEVKRAPSIYEGPARSVEALEDWRDGRSLIADSTREGIVLAPIAPLFDVYGRQVIAKMKGEAFKETAHAPKVLTPRVVLVEAAALAEEYVTPERLRHVLDQVAEVDPAVDPLDVRSTGDVLRAMYQDVVREAGSDYEGLPDDDKKGLGKAINKVTLELLAAARRELLEVPA